jgi:ketosteroid isomerase-like protein
MKTLFAIKWAGVMMALTIASLSHAQPPKLPASGEPNFSVALSRHLAAISARDMAGIEATITEGDALMLVLPNGKRTATRKEYIEFHKTFFAASSWKMRFEPVSEVIGSDVAVATVHSYYSDVDEGKPINAENWLTFVFKKEKNGWRLVSDQNTRLPQPVTNKSG